VAIIAFRDIAKSLPGKLIFVNSRAFVAEVALWLVCEMPSALRMSGCRGNLLQNSFAAGEPTF